MYTQDSVCRSRCSGHPPQALDVVDHGGRELLGHAGQLLDRRDGLRVPAGQRQCLRPAGKQTTGSSAGPPIQQRQNLI
ncbi:hypothetical protein [Micromonospora maris]|uniref:hypothetical protein n=1 Tax=Micromonospora maris TaxID=1003110 RepID=UPI002E0F018B|nr:hypothetical protein OG712_14135 [Micromonospora maris]